ncbi:MAG: hypothetical protein MJZ11_03035 [Lachnospiraceae bacterium]|nr:hypothetical protein [Lachnospiraceae bacterium]
MGIQFYNGLSNYSYNDYNRRNIPQVTPEEALANENALKVNAAKEENTVSSSPVVDNRSRVATLEDVSLTFNKEDSFDYIGTEAPIEKLDMQQAISDMKKDNILKEYNYFVGSSKNLYQDADGAVIIK